MERSALITTVCLNPSIDQMLVIDGFAYGGLNRVRDSRYDAGGKGLNVAVTASALGAEAECAGFMFKESARLFETRLRKSGTAYRFRLAGGQRPHQPQGLRPRARRGDGIQRIRPPSGAGDLERMTELVGTGPRARISSCSPARCRRVAPRTTTRSFMRAAAGQKLPLRAGRGRRAPARGPQEPPLDAQAQPRRTGSAHRPQAWRASSKCATRRGN